MVIANMLLFLSFFFVTVNKNSTHHDAVIGALLRNRVVTSPRDYAARIDYTKC